MPGPRSRAHVPVGNYKQLCWLEGRVGVGGSEVGEISRGLGDDGAGCLDLTLQETLWREEEWGHGEDVSETLASLRLTQQTSSCARDHRRSLCRLVHRTVCSSAGASIPLIDDETKQRYVNL